MARVLFFGDSITFGAGDPMGGWAARVAGHIRRWAESNNLGVPGDTSTGLAERLVRQSEELLIEEAEPLFVVAIGINDVCLGNMTSLPATLDGYRENLAAIAAAIDDFKGSAVFVGLTPVDEGAISPDTWRPIGHDYRNQDIMAMNEVLTRFCSEQGHPLVSVYDEMTQAGLPAILCDGLHPNGAGHELIHGIFLEELAKIWPRPTS